jgi:hypothetical protein
LLLCGLALGVNAGHSAVGNSTGGYRVFALVAVVVGAVGVTAGVGSLLIERRKNRR